MFPKFDDLFKKSFEQWEKQTAEQWNQMLHDPAFLKSAWSAMEIGLQARQQWNKASEQWLTAWQLPTRENQERLQHQMNRLQMALDGLTERVDRLLAELDGHDE